MNEPHSMKKINGCSGAFTLIAFPHTMKKKFFILQLMASGLILSAQPVPGDLFKEYAWFNASGDCNGALRVGGRLDYQIIENVDDYQGNGLINPPFNVELEHAIRAELVIEKMLCHGDTEGLRVSINGYHPIRLPEAEHILKPQSAYAHHYNAVVPVALSTLKEGSENSFLFEVDTAGHWWPQNLVYGMILRVYYHSAVLETRGKITLPKDGDTLGALNPITLQTAIDEQIQKIDLVGFYEDADLEGDGLYTQWHYGYHKCQIYNHIGTISKPPYEFQWSTEWLPDQEEKMRITAYIHRSDGYIYMTEPVVNLELKRPGISVELCKPYRRPKDWFTRNGAFEERIQIKKDLEKAIQAKMVFRTWSPGYFNGIYINDFIVFIKEGPKYDYYQHDIPLEALYALKQGENILKTGITPLYPEGMVHGVEVQWPGIMLLIKYKTTD
jgi:hypothetical protein